MDANCLVRQSNFYFALWQHFLSSHGYAEPDIRGGE